jgi:hypothetical protein
MKRSLIILAVTLLVACSPVKKYEKLPEVLAWESDIRQFDSLNHVNTYPENAILVAGSSSIRLWSTLDQDLSPYPVIQRGYGGAKLSDFAVYAGRIFSPHKCRALVMFIANDITGSENDKTPEEVGKLAAYVMKTFQKTNPGKPVFWIAVTPTAARWKVWDKIKEANEKIREACEKNGSAFFIRTDFAFLDDSGNPRTELFIEDKLHLNSQGYAIWTGLVKKELDRVLTQAKP